MKDWKKEINDMMNSDSINGSKKKVIVLKTDCNKICIDSNVTEDNENIIHTKGKYKTVISKSEIKEIRKAEAKDKEICTEPKMIK